MSLATLALVYVLGGLTFIPLVLLSLFAFAYTTLSKSAAPPGTERSKIATETPSPGEEVKEKSKEFQDEPEVAAAYFAVCREYVPGGINGKPPERSTPAGEVLIAESPSVYQTMYRSIFERGKTSIPTIEGDKKDGRAVKKARNVFFVVLRHGHLMLYDDSEQLEVRHVVSLAHHSVDIYAGGDPVPEGDLWIKRNCIRLTRKPLHSDTTPSSKPFYLFSDNCSEKEDFYYTILQTQSSVKDADCPPRPQQFDTQHAIKLIQNLHASDSDVHSRWINAMIGRIFLAMYKTEDLENVIRAKINRKISRVPKPNFINSIQIRDIDMGDSGPVISNPKLREFNVNGEMIVELDIKYNGGFKLQMSALARIELGSRFKPREVTLVLAGILRKLSGHLLVKIKPPPSNRLWFTFETMPHLEMSIEPVVSSRQITYGVILRAIESRIREVMGETLVLPNWDDSPFLDTSKKEVRGGIWKANASRTPPPKVHPDEPDHGVLESALHELSNTADDDNNNDEAEDPNIARLKDSKNKTMSMPSLFEPVQKISLRKAARKSVVTLAGGDVSSAASSRSNTTTGSMPVVQSTPPRKPKTMRSNSFASAATPLVSTSGANIEAIKAEGKSGHREAVDLVKEVKSRTFSNSHPSPAMLPSDQDYESASSDALVETPEEDLFLAQSTDTILPASPRRQSEPVSASSSTTSFEPLTQSRSPSIPESSIFPDPILSHRASNASNSSGTATPSPSHHNTTPSHIATAANAAKKWGWQVLKGQGSNTGGAATTPVGNTHFGFGKTSKNATPTLRTGANTSSSSLHTHPVPPPHPEAVKAASATLREPIGRGQPLPPPGVPLPGPQKSLWSGSALNIGGLKRKPVPPPPSGGSKPPPPALPPRNPTEPRRLPEDRVPPPLPARRKMSTQSTHSVESKASYDSHAMAGVPEGERSSLDMLVVAAPEDDESAPPTPAAAEHPDHDLHGKEEPEAKQGLVAEHSAAVGERVSAGEAESVVEEHAPAEEHEPAVGEHKTAVEEHKPTVEEHKPAADDDGQDYSAWETENPWEDQGREDTGEAVKEDKHVETHVEPAEK